MGPSYGGSHPNDSKQRCLPYNRQMQSLTRLPEHRKKRSGLPRFRVRGIFLQATLMGLLRFSGNAAVI